MGWKHTYTAFYILIMYLYWICISLFFINNTLYNYLSIELHKANLVGLEVQYYPSYPGPFPAPGHGHIGQAGYPGHAPGAGAGAGMGGVLTSAVSKLPVPMWPGVVPTVNTNTMSTVSQPPQVTSSAPTSSISQSSWFLPQSVTRASFNI